MIDEDAYQERFRILLRMVIRPGMAAKFESTWTAIGDVIARHPANLGQWLARDAEEADVYYIVSDWVNEPRFREFERSPEHLEHRRQLHPFRFGGSMTTMHVVRHMAGSPAGSLPEPDTAPIGTSDAVSR